MKVIPLVFNKYYMITVGGIELKAKYVGNSWFETIVDRYHMNEISEIREI